MKDLSQHIQEALKWDGSSELSFFGKIPGKLKWDNKMSKEYVDDGIAEDYACADCTEWFYAGVYADNSPKLVFWSPNSTWAFYFYASDFKRHGDKAWAAFGIDGFKIEAVLDPQTMCNQYLDDFDNTLVDTATLPEFAEFKAPAKAEKIAKEWLATIK